MNQCSVKYSVKYSAVYGIVQFLRWSSTQHLVLHGKGPHGPHPRCVFHLRPLGGRLARRAIHGNCCSETVPLKTEAFSDLCMARASGLLKAPTSARPGRVWTKPNIGIRQIEIKIFVLFPLLKPNILQFRTHHVWIFTIKLILIYNDVIIKFFP